jgi:uncharacterized membrane protein (UPF0182 family)
MEQDPFDDGDVIDISSGTGRKRRVGLIVLVVAVVLTLFFGSSLLSIYVDSQWFSSVGYADVYWYKFKLGGLLFLIFFVITFAIVRLAFALLNRAMPSLTESSGIRFSALQDVRDLNILPLIYRPAIWILSTIAGLIAASNFSQQWAAFALYWNAAPAGASDPVYNRDVGYYLFKLPVLELLSEWFFTLSGFLLLITLLLGAYVNYLNKMRGESRKITSQVVSSISVAAGVFALAIAFNTWLSRYDLLDNKHELFSGATYTDVNVRLPGILVLIVVIVLAAILLFANAFAMRRSKLIFWSLGAIIVTWLIAVLALPQSIYSFSVKPNELAKESPFIQHNIAATRHAFAIDRFQEQPFQPTPTLTVQEAQANQPTLNNIRLWDRGALQSVLGQIQEIRTYYEFKTPDVDRYRINGQLRQVLIAAREMNVGQLPEQSRNWINQHIVYTHGYGVAMATVNEFTSEGQPNLILKNMPVQSSAPEIKITQPEIYFGESTDAHVYVKTKPQSDTAPEFNYPAEGDEASYTEYAGKAGIPVGGFLKKLALATYLGDGTKLLFSDYVTPDSRLLMRRDVRERAQTIAPFLMFDDDPYIVIGKDGKLYWIIDAYTSSDRYPYSTEQRAGGQMVNYLRNSIKTVVDAYDGTVNFYIFDKEDAIVQSYRKIFPNLFHDASDMADDIREHVRYPSFYSNVQANAYTLYHIQNPQTFYNHEDMWAIPTEEAMNAQTKEVEYVRPYHLLMQLPTEKQNLEFINVLPFTPVGQGRNNMIGWMAARSDGDNYGHTLVFTFPKNVTINGPAQIRARINQDPQLSAQMTLWNQKGSTLLRGSLLVIPIADTLLYVEPFYLQAENSPLPELRQVAIATQDRLTTGKTFDEALNNLLPALATQKETSATPNVAKEQPPSSKPTTPAPVTSQAPASESPDIDRLARQAQQLLSDYERLTAEGKHRDAGDKLDQLKQTLQELARRRTQ